MELLPRAAVVELWTVESGHNLDSLAVELVGYLRILSLTEILITRSISLQWFDYFPFPIVKTRLASSIYAGSS
jgi:hypothetical protein